MKNPFKIETHAMLRYERNGKIIGYMAGRYQVEINKPGGTMVRKWVPVADVLYLTVYPSPIAKLFGAKPKNYKSNHRFRK